MITKESIENLKTHLDVVDIISQFIELKKTGANFKACCPFHGESTPSFVVSPAKQIYHCFGCGVGGDSIKFLMEYEKLSYPETLEKLADMVNVSLEHDTNVKKIDTSVITSTNEYYMKKLKSNSKMMEYLRCRGVNNESIENFEIGYADISSDTIQYLKNGFFNLQDAQELGLIDTGTNGLYSRFIERITFPIYTITGNIVGFSGRTMNGHSAKYVNTPQTKLFNKSRLLYGYHLAKDTIYKKKQIIITEGQLDVVMLHQAGYKNTVATSGTALTKEHLPLISRGEPEVIIAYDGDKAGINAAYKAALMLSQGNFIGGVVIFKDGIDPADMVKDNRITELNEMFSNPIPFISYAIDFIIKKFNIENPHEKQQTLKESNDYLKTLNPILQEEYQSVIASKLNINTNLIQIQKESNRVPTVTLSQIDIAELSIIKTAIEDKNLLMLLKKHIISYMFQVHKREFDILLSDANSSELLNIVLNDEIKLYSKDEFSHQLSLLALPYYVRKLQQIGYNSELDFREKSKQTRKIKEKITYLKKEIYDCRMQK